MAQLTLSAENRKVLEQLGHHLTEIALKYGEFMALYKTNVKTIQDTAPVFINLAGECIFNDLLLSFQRLCDPARMRGKDNLTFEYLAAAIDEPEKTEYLGKLNALKATLGPVEMWRHKRGAHNDLLHALGKVRLPPIEYARIKTALGEASDLLNMVNTWLAEPHTRYYEVSVKNGAEMLLLYLQWGKKWADAEFGGDDQPA
jgi:hypothetical protein